MKRALAIAFILHMCLAKNEQCKSDGTCLGDDGFSVSRGWNGSPRLIVDNVVKQDTCAKLLEVSSKYAKVGGNYELDQQRKHGAPYTDAEHYTGVDLSRLRSIGESAEIQLVERTATDVKVLAKVLMNRHNIQFDLVDLVCRESVEGEIHENQFSFGLHADYCHIEEDGSCVPYEINNDMNMRTTVAFLYLTEVNDGGELLLANRPGLNIESEIKPKCGRLVAIDSGEYKAIKAVKNGKRCELAIWFKNEPRKVDPIVSKPGISLGWNNNIRLIQENLISRDDCHRMMELGLIYGEEGAGYMNNTKKKHGSIHTDSEYFTGVSLQRLRSLKEANRADVDLLQETADLVLKQVENHLGRGGLEFDLVDLACRMAVEGAAHEDDFSLGAHADNCDVQPDGSCIPFKTAPGLIVRNTTAFVYLNDDFQGGEFFFAQRPSKEATHIVEPSCGKLVAFDSREFHGVKAVTRGRRCALGIWFRHRQ